MKACVVETSCIIEPLHESSSKAATDPLLYIAMSLYSMKSLQLLTVPLATEHLVCTDHSYSVHTSGMYQISRMSGALRMPLSCVLRTSVIPTCQLLPSFLTISLLPSLVCVSLLLPTPPPSPLSLQKYLAPQLVFLSDDPNDRDALYNSMRIYGTILLIFLALIVFVGVKFVSSMQLHCMIACPVAWIKWYEIRLTFAC